MERNRVHTTRTTPANAAFADWACVVSGSSEVYHRRRRDWRNPQSPIWQSATSYDTSDDCVCLLGALDGAWFGATHTTTQASMSANEPPMQDTNKEVSKKARANAQPAKMQPVKMQSAKIWQQVSSYAGLAQRKFNVHCQERGWVLKPKPMQRCRRDAACEQLEETRTLEQPCAQRPPKTHSIKTSATIALTPTELSFRSPLRLRAQVSGERPDRDIMSHLSVYRMTTLFA